MAALKLGRAVIIGFPEDEGVQRNGGRPGAAEAPHEIRHWLFRLSPWDPESDVHLAEHPPLDAGNIRIESGLEKAQAALAEVVAGVLNTGAVPIVLGGGHETAFGHFLGYVAAERQVAIINLDAHLDLRPCVDGKGHSGSPFRQALEHADHPLPGNRYVCLGAQPSQVCRGHWLFAREHGCTVRWAHEVKHVLGEHFCRERDRLAAADCGVYLSIDADVIQAADVPGVSSPNLLGLPAEEIIACARLAGHSSQVSSMDLVEINPWHDRDNQSARWGALAIWNFLVGLACRPG